MENPILFLSAGANIKFEKARELPGYVILGNLARQELLWWIENI